MRIVPVARREGIMDSGRLSWLMSIANPGPVEEPSSMK